MRPSLASALLFAGIAALPACTNRTIDEAYGVPDALDWSYFMAPPAEVAEATRRALLLSNFTVESVSGGAGTYTVTVTAARPSADFTQIRIEAASFEEYRARAQLFPRGQKLPSDLEVAISAEL